jgi:hypothetical protein
VPAQVRFHLRAALGFRAANTQALALGCHAHTTAAEFDKKLSGRRRGHQ